MILAADDVRDLHQSIVDDHGEVVRRDAAGTQEDEVTDHPAAERDAPAHQIGEGDLTVAVRHAEADYRRFTTLDTPPRLVTRNVAATAHVFRRLAGAQRLVPVHLELLLGTEAVVGPVA